MTYEHDRINDLEDQRNDLLAALRDIKEWLEQSNRGRGPTSTLNTHLLLIARAAIAKAKGEHETDT